MKFSTYYVTLSTFKINIKKSTFASVMTYLTSDTSNSQRITSLMAKYPELITYRKARVIKEVLAKHPSGEETIIRAVEALIDTPQMDQSELSAVLLKPFEAKRVRVKASAPRTINDKNGESAFQVQVKSRDIVIQVEDGVDVELALQSAVAALREFAVTLELPRKQKPSKTSD